MRSRLQRAALWLSSWLVRLVVCLDEFGLGPVDTQAIPVFDAEMAERLRAVFQPAAVAQSADREKVEAAVHAAYTLCGQPEHLYAMSFDLSRTGKLFEVLHHAAIALDVDHHVNTVGDLVDILEAALRTQ